MFRSIVLLSLVAIVFSACDGQQPQECACTCPPVPVCAPAPVPVDANSGGITLRPTEQQQRIQNALRREQEFQLLVNYERPLNDAIADGKFEWVHSHLWSEHVPLSVDEQGAATRLMQMFCFGQRTVSSEDVVAAMSAKSYRPATLRELLAFASMTTADERIYPVVALGSVLKHADGNRVPYLGIRGNGRGLGLRWWSGDSGAGWRYGCFMAVHKP